MANVVNGGSTPSYGSTVPRSPAGASQFEIDALRKKYASMQSTQPVNTTPYTDEQINSMLGGAIMSNTPLATNPVTSGPLPEPSGFTGIAGANPNNANNTNNALERGFSYGKDYGAANFARGIDLGKESGDIFNLYKQQLGGLDAANMAGQRDQANMAIQGQQMSNQRGLEAAQRRAGVRGAAAVAQQTPIFQAAQSARGDFERDLMLQNQSVKERALNSLQGVMSGERYGRMSSELGFGSLYAQDAASRAQQDILSKMLANNQQELQGIKDTPIQELSQDRDGKTTEGKAADYGFNAYKKLTMPFSVYNDALPDWLKRYTNQVTTPIDNTLDREKKYVEKKTKSIFGG